MDKIGDGLKKVILAGIGAAAITGEKTSEVLGRLVEKGELTVEQGKALNEELKHAAEEKKAEKEKKPETEEETRKDVSEILNGMTAEQLDTLKNLLNAVGAKTAEGEKAEEDKNE